MPKVALLSWLLYFAVAVVYRVLRQLRMTRRSGIVVPRFGAPPVQLLASALFIGSIALGFGAVATAWLAPNTPFFAITRTPTPAWLAAGLVLYACGLSATLASQLVMGRSWRVGVEPAEHTDLVVHGPFRIVRNPIYSAMLLAIGGITLLVPSAAAVAGYLLLFVALELQVRAVEEPHLVRMHGAAYREYAARAGRFVPGLGRFGGHTLVRPPAIRIRAARASDVPALIAMMVEFNRFENIPWRPREVERALRQLLRKPELGMVLVAEHAKQAIGYTIATYNYDLEFAGRDAFVTELFLDASQRGHGIAERLLTTLVARLKRAGANAVHLLVRPQNRRARALYTRVGFEVIPRLIMTKRLR